MVKTMFRRIYYGAGAIAALVCISCDRVPLLAPTNSTVTIDAQSRVLPTGGSTEVTATVLESGGTPVQNGTVVRFTTSLGRLDPVEAQTRNGVAVTTFLAGNDSGIAEVRATSGGAGGATTTTPGSGSTPGTTTTTNSNIVQIAVGGAAIDAVTLRANPANVPSSGGTVTLIATVTGTNGRLLQGIPVNFSPTRGTLSSSSALSDASGNATVTLTTSGETEVTATAGSKTSTAVKITALVAPAVSLTCAIGNENCSAATIGQTVTFTAARTSGTIVSSNLDFGDGSNVDLGALSGSTTVPHQYSQAGTYTARLTARDANGETANPATVVQVLALATADLTVSNSGLTVTATVTTSVPATQYQFTFETGATQTTTSPTATHTYAAPGGTKTVAVVVTLVDGRTVTVSRNITVP
jgi:adhesin/invasin